MLTGSGGGGDRNRRGALSRTARWGREASLSGPRTRVQVSPTTLWGRESSISGPRTRVRLSRTAHIGDASPVFLDRAPESGNPDRVLGTQACGPRIYIHYTTHAQHTKLLAGAMLLLRGRALPRTQAATEPKTVMAVVGEG